MADTAEWRAWLDANEDGSDGVWLVLAKKGTTAPTTLTYAQALDEALCSGWIDGQKRRGDSGTFHQRFTPRRRASVWSQRNTEIVARLAAEGRIRARGQAEVDRAKADGRWERAYGGSATAEIPPELADALAAAPAAGPLFDGLDATNRYAFIHRVQTAVRPEVRTARAERLVDRLLRGETPHPRPPQK